jgi:hypothetical protein
VIPTTTEAYSKTSASKARSVTPQDRASFAWLMEELHPGALWRVRYRGREIEATAEMALKFCAWGGQLIFTTYQPRGG